MAHAVFISYSANDTEVAEAICSTLESRGIKCWMAPRDVLPGQHWGEAIIDAINEAQVVLVVFSPSANASTQVLREVERAADKGVPIISFRLENVPLTKSLEYFLSGYQWFDAAGRPLEACLEKLADTIERLLLLPEARRYEEPKRRAAPGPISLPAARKQHPFLFWLGLLSFVGSLISMIVIVFVAAETGGQDASAGAVLGTIPFVLLGILFIWLSRRRIRHGWFWPGVLTLGCGIGLVFGWVGVCWHDHASLTSADLIGLTGFIGAPIIIGGAFCLWKGWPRIGVKRPRTESSGFLSALCLVCLGVSLILVATGPVPVVKDILSFSDNFDDGNADGWKLDPGWRVVRDNGNYVLDGQGQDFQRAWPSVTSAFDYALEADFLLVSGEFDIHIRNSTAGCYPVFLKSDNIVLDKEGAGGSYVNLAKADLDIGFKRWHHVEVVLKGKNIRVYIDGNLDIDYSDADPLKEGNFFLDCHPNSHIFVDNISVRPY